MNLVDLVPLHEHAVAEKTALAVVHLVGVGPGLGAATLLDLPLVEFLSSREILEEPVQVIEFSSRVANFGLVLLRLSGIGLFLHHDLFEAG